MIWYWTGILDRSVSWKVPISASAAKKSPISKETLLTYRVMALSAPTARKNINAPVVGDGVRRKSIGTNTGDWIISEAVRLVNGRHVASAMVKDTDFEAGFGLLLCFYCPLAYLTSCPDMIDKR